MESSPTSKCVATTRGGNDQKQARYGICMDGEWERQRICEGTSAREPVQTRKFSFTLLAPIVVIDKYMTSAVGRRREGFDIYARSGNDPR